MLKKALNQSSPTGYFDKITPVCNYEPKCKICKCGNLSLNEEQEFNHKPCCKEK